MNHLKRYIKKAGVHHATMGRWVKNPLKMQLEDVEKVAFANCISPTRLAAQIFHDSELETQLTLGGAGQ